MFGKLMLMFFDFNKSLTNSKFSFSIAKLNIDS